MKLVEGTHYRRRYHQPIPTPPKSKELVSCLWCDTSSYPDDAEHSAETVGRNKRVKGVMRLDKLMKHISKDHPECIPAEGRSLLDMGFTMDTGGEVSAAQHTPEHFAADDVPDDAADPMLADDVAQNTTSVSAADVARNTPANGSLEAAPQLPIATAEIRGQAGQQHFWRSLTTTVEEIALVP